jgi:flagellum-specific peptidoglycan hydrolase FlgJ
MVHFKSVLIMATKSNTLRTNHNIITFESGLVGLNVAELKQFASRFLIKNWLNILIFILLMYVVFTKNVQVTLNMNENGAAIPKAKAAVPKKDVKKLPPSVSPAAEAPEGRLHDVRYNELSEEHTDDNNTTGVIELLPATIPVEKKSSQEANLFNNVNIFWQLEKTTPSVVQSKKGKCWDYISRFAPIAKLERQKFGIPVSITLAQGLLESDAGESKLTQAANNHFGIKTFTKRVPHVVMRDDTPTDKFKKYESAWASFRDHSLLLLRDHYKHLQYLSKTDYVGWARGLQKAGYATDKQYAEKLIRLIESLQLYKFDDV